MYAWFNYVEAVLWIAVAVFLAVRVPRRLRAELLGVVIGCIAFVMFGLTDVLEAPYFGRLPWWLWAAKVVCGAGILAARYTYIGWNRWRWHDREMLFATACAVAVGVVIVLQRWL